MKRRWWWWRKIISYILTANSSSWCLTNKFQKFPFCINCKHQCELCFKGKFSEPSVTTALCSTIPTDLIKFLFLVSILECVYYLLLPFKPFSMVPKMWLDLSVRWSLAVLQTQAQQPGAVALYPTLLSCWTGLKSDWRPHLWNLQQWSPLHFINATATFWRSWKLICCGSVLMNLLQKGQGNYKGNLFLQVAGHFLWEVPLKSTENQLAILVFLAYVFLCHWAPD